MDLLISAFPDYARDIKLNLQNVMKQEELSAQQTWGAAVASAIAARSDRVTSAIVAEAANHLSPEAMNAAKAAAAVMGMNNIYYRFQHLSGNEKYGQIPARLRMQVIRSHGSGPVDFELWCIAVSAVNGCGVCIAAHEKLLLQKRLPEEKITAVVRIASVVHAAAVVMDAEGALTSS